MGSIVHLHFCGVVTKGSILRVTDEVINWLEGDAVVVIGEKDM